MPATWNSTPAFRHIQRRGLCRAGRDAYTSTDPPTTRIIRIRAAIAGPRALLRPRGAMKLPHIRAKRVTFAPSAAFHL